ncbi:hypothetical protein RB653_002865 [Dictyostelium firmibasis]|uniref:Uncharacterized protein n=1 Tax=Dictyostelium firmibasis TaxID=79012 RepID=A0AAN7TX92_9MYCE
MATRDRTPSLILLKIEYNNEKSIGNNKKKLKKKLEEEYGLIQLVTPNNNNNSDSNNNSNNINNNGADCDINDNKNNILQQINYLPEWMKRINDIDINLSKISILIDKLKRYYEKDLQNKENQSNISRLIETATFDIARLFHLTHDLIRILGANGSILSKEEIMIKINIQQSKSISLNSYSLIFREIQISYLFSIQKILNDNNNLKNTDNNIENCDYDINEKEKKIIYLFENEIYLKDKDNIKNILNSIKYLSQLFQNINLLVKDQGILLLDRIDYNLYESNSNSNSDI